jgi:regulator of cell morphogenesis and NO signaling
MDVTLPVSKKSKVTNIFFAGDVKMADLLMANSRLFYTLPCFGIGMGFGEKTIAEVCDEHGVSLPLFLIFCNLYTFEEYTPSHSELKRISLEDVIAYLECSHKLYLETYLPRILDKVLTLDEEHLSSATKNMLAAFCEKYRQDATAHMQYEEEYLFPHARKLLAGEKSNFTLNEFETGHRNIGVVLSDLRSLIVKYVPDTCSIEQCFPVLSDLYLFEYDLHKHTRLEDTVLIPLIEHMAEEGRKGYSAELSEREKQALIALACGLSNKEIADKLNISIHTVISHRKNIIRKTGIKTVQGLTLYAFFNDMITPKDLR